MKSSASWFDRSIRAIPLTLLALSCASPQPQLYPNERLEAVGIDQSKRDIAYCQALANEYVANPDHVKKAAVRTAGGAAGGAALGAIGGAIAGDAGEGAAIGAAVGAAGGILASLVAAGKPNPTYQNFVDHCLERQGYEVVGWE
jgi:hypothetical protein